MRLIGAIKMASRPEPTHKYRLTMAHILERSNVHKLERDGFSNGEIHRVLHNEMKGCTKSEKEQVISKLYDRKE